MKKITVIKFLILVFLFISMLFTINACKKRDETEKILGCTNIEALNYNVSANEDDGSCVIPEQKFRTIVLNITSLTCGNCGSYGIPALISAYSTYPNNVVPIKANSGDALSSPVGVMLSSYYNYSSIPYFAVGNDHGIFYSNVNSTVAGQITSTPNIGVAGVFSISGSTISVKTQVKFFSASSGDYYLAVYLMEDGISATQDGASTNPFIHNKVLKGNATSITPHGEMIATAAIAAGKIINKTYTASVPAGCNASNMYAALVIWKNNGSSWEFINAFQTKTN